MIYHNKKYKAWEVLKTYHENKFKYNSDFTYKINDRFTIEVNLLTSNDDSVLLRANLIQDDGFVLYNVDMIPVDDIWQVVNGFEYIASILILKLSLLLIENFKNTMVSLIVVMNGSCHICHVSHINTKKYFSTISSTLSSF